MIDFVLLLGLPGSGKGTQAQQLAKRYGFIHVSCGDVFRRHIRDRTDFGGIARSYLEKGLLTPDEHTCAMFIDHLATLPPRTSNALLEGFPRTPQQVEALSAYLTRSGNRLSHVVHIKVSPERASERIVGRQICMACGAIYNEEYKPPREEGTCDEDGQALVVRADDTKEAAATRIAATAAVDASILASFEVDGIVTHLDGNLPAADITKNIERTLGLA
jgi:adenylate kinase